MFEILLPILMCLISRSHAGYVAHGSDYYETPLLVTPKYPNSVSANVSQFRPTRWRISPDFIFGFNSSTTMLRFELKVDEDTPSMFPVFISLIQRYSTTQVELPLSVHSKTANPIRYTTASRTLCLMDINEAEKDAVLVAVATGSSQLIGFHMMVKVIQEDSQLILDKSRKLSTSPTTPILIRVPFHANGSQNVALHISASNENCLAVGIQEPKCPASFLPSEDNFRGGNEWKIMSKNGLIRVDMTDYLRGFFVKVVVLSDDTLCGKMYSKSTGHRYTDLNISLKNDLPISVTNGHFLLQIAIPPLLSLIVGVIVVSVYLITYTCSRRRMLACRTYNVNKSETKAVCVKQFSQSQTIKPNKYGKWTIMVSLLYALPILEQTVYNGLISMNNNSGLYGICSYNSLCSHKFWIFQDANHLWSNVSYLVLGVCFIFVSFMKQFLQKKSEEQEGVQYFVGLYYAMGLGLIAKGLMSFTYHFCPSKSNFQYDMIYLAVLIGICQVKLFEARRPNTVSIGFSCAALIIILTISTLGIAFERYFRDFEDTFFGFRIAAAVMQGIFIFYASVYSLYCGYPIKRVSRTMDKQEVVPLQRISGTAGEARVDSVTVQAFTKTLGNIPRFLWIFPKLWQWKLPKFRWERFLYALLLLSLNSFLIYFSLTANYFQYVFFFLGANFGLNIVYYILMKIVFGEFTCKWKSVQVFVYLTVALSVGVVTGFLFLQNEWSEPSTQHKDNDEACMWVLPYPFYDKHDIFHMLSAHVLFFTFMVLLSIDDGIEGVNQEYLLVF
ncbi:uncharacterized protein LOC110847732 isoform X2 [Folsomia candida]|uniref:uncharacterized protein LOC110847732 isoform X2 n=1 Tax=Folsomia candida TaxID=158441 RepID=UPI001604D51B|nr:uncharacterized protein LOC110847732 isoform X2 [Folsomia candida]